MKVTDHCLARFCLHHPGGTDEDVLSAWSSGVEVSGEIVAALAGRQPQRKGDTSTYRLTTDRRGVLVYRTGGLITYLRLSASQEAFCRRFWDGEGQDSGEDSTGLLEAPAALPEPVPESAGVKRGARAFVRSLRPEWEGLELVCEGPVERPFTRLANEPWVVKIQDEHGLLWLRDHRGVMTIWESRGVLYLAAVETEEREEKRT